jgi:16S rRNA (adenine1518-N6/adenine1519-N6)-dimethyltransferase
MKPKKALGQHFLVDKNIINKIIGCAQLKEDDLVIEIGAGHGELTLPLSEKVSHVFAIEKDAGLCYKLRKSIKDKKIKNITVVKGDVLKLDLKELGDFSKNKPVIMGNIPYNISSLILKKLIENKELLSKAVLMFQLEYAKRLTALPGTKDYGALTLLISYHATVKELFQVSRNVFYPKPSVDSMLVEIRFDKSYPEEEHLFRYVVNATFSHRRKKILNSLFNYMKDTGISKDQLKKLLSEANIAPNLRAEVLGINDFLRLSAKLKEYLPKSLIHTQ